jgi:hypothetical protein
MSENHDERVLPNEPLASSRPHTSLTMSENHDERVLPLDEVAETPLTPGRVEPVRCERHDVKSHIANYP